MYRVEAIQCEPDTIGSNQIKIKKNWNSKKSESYQQQYKKNVLWKQPLGIPLEYIVTTSWNTSDAHTSKHVCTNDIVHLPLSHKLFFLTVHHLQ